uniref:NADH-ubiquinone oxidoreductase chain 3 n=1 Tax=Arcuatula senhousia TaxID=1954227 RepID=E2DHW2_ARCSE|nr:NADH dehydrogenase subunit 3 [Arcuatula senhousia]ACY00223.1 NADH dehydrogenase subunit 3 [Arcuatula senhousia]
MMFSFLGSEVVVVCCFLVILSFSLLPGILLIMSSKSDYSREKLSPYECGFEPVSSARSSFSIRFFLVAVLFVVFDVELSILLAIIFSTSLMKNLISLLSVIFFLLILFLGLFHEFREGSLNWVS